MSERSLQKCSKASSDMNGGGAGRTRSGDTGNGTGMLSRSIILLLKSVFGITKASYLRLIII